TKLGVAHVLTLGGNGEGSLMDKAGAVPAGFPPPPRTAAHLPAVLYTPGPTAPSERAMLTHPHPYFHAATLKDYWRFTKDDVLLHALPIFHTHGLFVASNVTLLAGASMIFLSKFDGDEVMKLLPRATSMMGVPTFYVRLLQSPALTKD